MAVTFSNSATKNRTQSFFHWPRKTWALDAQAIKLLRRGAVKRWREWLGSCPFQVLENCGRREEESGVQIRETLGHSMRTWGRMRWDYLRDSIHTAARARTAPGQPLLLCDSAAQAQATVQRNDPTNRFSQRAFQTSTKQPPLLSAWEWQWDEQPLDSPEVTPVILDLKMLLHNSPSIECGLSPPTWGRNGGRVNVAEINVVLVRLS